MNSITIENIIKSYEMLGSEDPSLQQAANYFLFTLVEQDQVWVISNKMITELENVQYKFLGAQILYQKIQRQSVSFLKKKEVSYQMLKELQQFLFKSINNNNNKAVLDKLSSTLALVLLHTYSIQISNKGQCSWKQTLTDLIQFMKTSSENMSKGLLLLERLIQELSVNKAISNRLKNAIKASFLTEEDMLANVWLGVFEYSSIQTPTPKHLLNANMTCLQSWTKQNFQLLDYPAITKYVNSVSICSFQFLQTGSKIICESLKVISQSKFQVLHDIEPQKQRQAYNAKQIQSIKYILQFAITNADNFLGLSQVSKTVLPQSLDSDISQKKGKKKKTKIDLQPEYTQIYINIVKDLLLNMGFLLLQEVGFQLLSIMYKATLSNDLKLSCSTFTFWIDFSTKMINIRKASIKKIGQENWQKIEIFNIQNKIYQIFVQLFRSILSKNIYEDVKVLYEEGIVKDDETVDDDGSVSFKQYRNQSADLLVYLYDYFRQQEINFLKPYLECHTHQYFDIVHQLLTKFVESRSDWRLLQLAIFSVKSCIQSMVDDSSLQMTLKFVKVILKILNQSIKKQQIPFKVASQALNYFSNSTRQIKSNNQVFIQCLKFTLCQINKDKIKNYAADTFKVLMQQTEQITDKALVENLIQYFEQQRKQKMTLIQNNLQSLDEQSEACKHSLLDQKILEGIFQSILKFQQKALVPQFLNKLLLIIEQYYKFKEKVYNLFLEAIQKKQIVAKSNYTFLFYDSLVEIKIILEKYEDIDNNFKKVTKPLFFKLCYQAMKIIQNIFEITFNKSIVEPKYSLLNELGISVSTFKYIVRIVGTSDTQTNVELKKIMDILLLVLNHKLIKNLFPILGIFNELLLFKGLEKQQTSQQSVQIQVKQPSSGTFQNVSFKIKNRLIDQWILTNAQQLDIFFIEYFLKQVSNLQIAPNLNMMKNSIDPDVIKCYFGILQSIINYYPTLYLIVRCRSNAEINQRIIQSVKFCLKYINQKLLHRKIITYLSLYVNSVQKQLAISSQSLIRQRQEILQSIFLSIPHLNNFCFITAAKTITFIICQLPHEQRQPTLYRHVCNILFNYNKHPSQYLSFAEQQKIINSSFDTDIKLFSKLLNLALQTKIQIQMKMILNHLHEVTRYQRINFEDKQGILSTNSRIQLEMSLQNWMRDLKKKQVNTMKNE